MGLLACRWSCACTFAQSFDSSTTYFEKKILDMGLLFRANSSYARIFNT